MRRTSVYHATTALGAEYIPGIDAAIPVTYGDIEAEMAATQNAASLTDVSTMGKFEVVGKDALAVMEKILCNNPAKATDGQVVYSGILNENGGLVDDILVYRISKDKWLMTGGPQDGVAAEKAAEGKCAHVTDVTWGQYLLSLQGPASRAILEKATGADLSNAKLPYMRFATYQIAGYPTQISRTGFTGELGYELIGDAGSGEEIWKAIMAAGKDLGIRAAGYLVLRRCCLEKRYLVHGRDVNEEIDPISTGLGWYVKFDHDFIGRKALEKIKAQGSPRKLIEVELKGVAPDAVIAKQTPVLADGKQVGSITHAAYGIRTKKYLAFALVDEPYASKVTTYEVDSDGKKIPASLLEGVVYDPKNERLRS